MSESTPILPESPEGIALAEEIEKKNFLHQQKKLQNIAKEVSEKWNIDLERLNNHRLGNAYAKSLTARDTGLPIKLNVEVICTCNFKCEFCIVHSGRLRKRRSKAMLSLQDFKTILPQLKEFTTYIEFTGGEPLLNPELADMIALCNQEGIKTTIATNANLLTQNKIKQLLENPPTELLVAWETGQEEIYSKQRINGKLEKLRSNIKNILNLRQKKEKKFPKIKLQTVISKKTLPFIDSFWNDAKLIGVDSACTKPIFVWPDGGDQYWSTMKSEFLIPESKFSYYKTDENDTVLPTSIQGFCPNTVTTHIGCSGEVIPCWYNLLESPSMGNCLENNFYDIWTSAGYKEFRNKMSKHEAYSHGCKYCIGIYKADLFEIWNNPDK